MRPSHDVEVERRHERPGLVDEHARRAVEPGAAPLDRPAGRAEDALEEARHRGRALDRTARRGSLASPVAVQHDVGGEGRAQALEVPAADGLEERVRDAAHGGLVGRGARAARREVPAGADGELPAVGRLELEHRGHLAELVAEDVVQEERSALRRAQALDRQEQRHRQGLVELVPGGDVRHERGAGWRLGERLRQPLPDVLLALALRRLDAVEAQPRAGAHEPGTHVVERGLARRLPAQEGLLRHVVRVRGRAQHAVREPREVAPVPLELLGDGHRLSRRGATARRPAAAAASA